MNETLVLNILHHKYPLWKPRVREVKLLFQLAQLVKWQTQDLNPYLFDLKVKVLK